MKRLSKILQAGCIWVVFGMIYVGCDDAGDPDDSLVVVMAKWL